MTDVAEIRNLNRVDLENQLIYLEKKREALEESIRSLQDENARLNNAILVMENRVKQMAISLERQQSITHQALENANKQNNEYLVEIERLRAELKCR